MKITASSTLIINKLSISWLATTDSNIYIEEITINCVDLATNLGPRVLYFIIPLNFLLLMEQHKPLSSLICINLNK